MSDGYSKIDDALQALREGQIIIVVDDEDREYDGDVSAAGVICEITDGIGMASREKLHEIAQEHGLPIVSIEALIKYRRLREKLVHRAAEADLPTRYGRGRIIGYRVEHEPGNEPVAFVMG